jgi:hypothetical protein
MVLAGVACKDNARILQLSGERTDYNLQGPYPGSLQPYRTESFEVTFSIFGFFMKRTFLVPGRAYLCWELELPLR